MNIDIKNRIESLPDSLKVTEVADLFRVDTRTVRNWIYEGRVDAIKPVGTYRIERSSLLRLCKDFTDEVPFLFDQKVA
jgi:excisionase family DNA binding protein|tara:strand:- start:365 stop:598 length:234 start_codon:yes stop_codon:yes gene_type:complete